MSQIPFTLVTEFKKNLEAKNCLYIKLAGVGRRVEEGREKLKAEEEIPMQYVLALTFWTIIWKWESSRTIGSNSYTVRVKGTDNLKINGYSK